MKVSEIMTTNVECISPDAGMTEIANRMKTLDVGFLAICENDRLVGTITDRDIVIRGIASGKNLDTLKARGIMSDDVFWCYEDDAIKDVAGKMREKNVRRMVLLTRDKRLAGVVSIGDISKVEEKESGKTLKDITEAA
jgi:CBS domain-containing protein